MTTKPELPETYRCPFCPSHVDDEFVWHDLAETYVCFGCQVEIDCGFASEQQPTVDDYNCADTVERLLRHLGISYAEAKKRQETILRHIPSVNRYIVIKV